MKEELIRAAEAALTEGCFTWQAICRATRDTEARQELLALFREYFRSETRWPDDDRETRCLAFLLLAEAER